MQGLAELGQRIRRQRRRLGLTLEEAAMRSGVSKPYLSLIETGRVDNPPSDAKLSGLESALSFTTGELLLQAHILRTPQDVRQMLESLLASAGQTQGISAQAMVSRLGASSSSPAKSHQETAKSASGAFHRMRAASQLSPGSLAATGTSGPLARSVSVSSAPAVASPSASSLRLAGGSSALGRPAHSRPAAGRFIPLIHCQAGSYPRVGVNVNLSDSASEHIDCPFVADESAFALKIDDPAMAGRYVAGDIVVFSPAAVWSSGDDCFVRLRNGQSTFRRVYQERDSAAQPRLRLQSLSGSRPPHYLLQVDVCGCDKAIYRYHRLEEAKRAVEQLNS